MSRTRSKSPSPAGFGTDGVPSLFTIPSTPLPDSDDIQPTFIFPSPRGPPPSASASTFLAPGGHRRSASGSSTYSAMDDSGSPSVSGEGTSPFNFQTQTISSSPVRSNIGQRRGHRYKHSSISTQHQIFPSPPLRPPAPLPASLPLPTVREALDSLTSAQRVRLGWSVIHLLVGVYVFFASHGSPTMMALSHFVFFDAGCAAICGLVDVLGNFDVWKRSTVRHPFGLARVEVLGGFAMSIFLVFGGFDIVSHNAKHFLQSPHHISPADSPLDTSSSTTETLLSESLTHDAHPINYTAPIISILATLLSTHALSNHHRITRLLPNLPLPLTTNPFHILTLLSAVLSLIPIPSPYPTLICLLLALAMFILGFRLAHAQASMLLMSYGGGRSRTEDRTVQRVVSEVEREPEVSKVEEARFWQVHYGLGMASLRVRVARGVDDKSLARLRTRVGNMVQNMLGEGYGQGVGGLRWEVTMETILE